MSLMKSLNKSKVDGVKGERGRVQRIRGKGDWWRGLVEGQVGGANVRGKWREQM